MKAMNQNKTVIHIPPANEIVLEFLYEGSSYLHALISAQNQATRLECVEKAEG